MNILPFKGEGMIAGTCTETSAGEDHFHGKDICI